MMMGTYPRDIAGAFTRRPAPAPPPPGDPTRRVAFDPPPDGSPPLLMVADRRLSAEAIRNIRAAMRDAIGSGTRAILVAPGLGVYQLVDGRWQPLGPRP